MLDIAAAPAANWETLIQVIGAVGALGTASVGLVDASKAVWGGVSNAGWKRLRAGLLPYAEAFDGSIGPDWEEVFRASWLNGAPKLDQLTNARNFIRLGLSERTASGLARACLVDAAALTAVAQKIHAGAPLDAREFELVGRMDASVEARLGAAYERADQIYRNVARLFAGVVAVLLALGGWILILGGAPQYFGLSLLAGVVAVPVAPLVKDLISAVSASAHAAKALKALP